MTLFEDKVVCITGASRGIGHSLADAFAREGARLLLLSRSEPALASRGCPEHTETIARQCDVSDFAAVQDAVASALDRWGRIDVLVNAAAILGPTGDLWENEPAAWTAAIATNLNGTFHTMKAVLPGMIARRAGNIINFAGGGAAYGYPRFSAYAASKVGVVRLTETVAAEVSPHGISVNVIAPGAIETEMLQAVRAAGGEVRTVGRIEQVRDIVFFLSNIQQASLSLDGFYMPKITIGIFRQTYPPTFTR